MAKHSSPRGRKVLRMRALQEKLGFPSASNAKSWVYREVAAGRFPGPIKLGGRASGWLEDEVDDWIAERAETREADLDRARQEMRPRTERSKAMRAERRAQQTAAD